jgi:multidrug efflux pump subunit AcrA (membrane-fusion protein)
VLSTAETPSISVSEAAGIVILAGQDLCPQTAQARAAAATAKAAAAKAAAAQAAAKAAAERAHAIHEARIAAENTPISATEWGDVIRNPDAYIGDIYTISGTVAEYNVNSNTFATNANAALVATDANGNSFVVEADSSLLGNVRPARPSVPRSPSRASTRARTRSPVEGYFFPAFLISFGPTRNVMLAASPAMSP